MTAGGRWKGTQPGAVAALTVLGAALVLSACADADDDSGPVVLSGVPCWGLVEQSDLLPVLEPGKDAKVQETDLERVLTRSRQSDCTVLQPGGAEISAFVEWRSQNPDKNPDPIRSWHGPRDVEGLIDKPWGVGAGSWINGARVALQCEGPAPDPSAAHAQDTFLEVRVTGSPLKGLDPEKARKTYAELTLKLAKGVAQKAGCTNDVNLP
ncbi:hypothetical protein [Streptomyces subrutilus]|uniref:hypothetical protein n=1 Tax=Streptomyces subrutilus TaxID=36818 RepID=UPI0033DB401D